MEILREGAFESKAPSRTLPKTCSGFFGYFLNHLVRQCGNEIEIDLRMISFRIPHSEFRILLTFLPFPYIIWDTGHDGKMLFPGGQRERSHRLKAARRQEKKDTPEPSCESRRLNRVIGLKSGAA